MAASVRKRASLEPPSAPSDPSKRSKKSKSVGCYEMSNDEPLAVSDLISDARSSQNEPPTPAVDPASPEPEKMDIEEESPDDLAEWIVVRCSLLEVILVLRPEHSVELC
jgi:hypothetical protein